MDVRSEEKVLLDGVESLSHKQEASFFMSNRTVVRIPHSPPGI